MPHTVYMLNACIWAIALSLTVMHQGNTIILPLEVYKSGYIGFSEPTGNCNLITSDWSHNSKLPSNEGRKLLINVLISVKC